ncbi:hypothetical protein [Aeromicrobium sp. UC242_57]|uniref:hypothetical protein n=1 Tax=Aeromicrobium sp. UC242_57 TaxID=3374624 RepID=UPI0037A35839
MSTALRWAGRALLVYLLARCAVLTAGDVVDRAWVDALFGVLIFATLTWAFVPVRRLTAIATQRG